MLPVHGFNIILVLVQHYFRIVSLQRFLILKVLGGFLGRSLGGARGVPGRSQRGRGEVPQGSWGVFVGDVKIS